MQRFAIGGFFVATIVVVATLAHGESVPNMSMIGWARPVVDGNDRLVWALDEATGSTTFVNSGAAGDTAGNTLTSQGTQYPGMAGVFGSSLFMPSSTYLKSATTGTLDKGGGVSQVTMSAWVQSTAASASPQIIVAKRVDQSVGALSGMGYTLLMGTTSTSFFCGVVPTTTVPAGRAVEACAGTGYGLRAGQWHHLGCSYTNGTFVLYRDGHALYSGAGWAATDLYSTIPTCSGSLMTPSDGTINYGASAASGGGTWFFGSTGTGTGAVAVEVDDIRIADVARPASWFTAMATAGPYRLGK